MRIYNLLRGYKLNLFQRILEFYIGIAKRIGLIPPYDSDGVVIIIIIILLRNVWCKGADRFPSDVELSEDRSGRDRDPSVV